jgi:hypothetical protein
VDLRALSQRGVEGTPYRMRVRVGETNVRARFPDAVMIGDGELEVEGVTVEEMNEAIAALITQGVRFIAVYPAHSVLEQQFRDAVRGEVDR